MSTGTAACEEVDGDVGRDAEDRLDESDRREADEVELPRVRRERALWKVSEGDVRGAVGGVVDIRTGGVDVDANHFEANGATGTLSRACIT